MTNEIHDKLGGSVQVTSVIKKLLKLKVVGLDLNLIKMDEKVFLNNLTKQNNLSNLKGYKDTKIIKKYIKNNNSGSVILEFNPEIHKFILENTTVKLGWTNYKVFNYIDVARCFKCWGYHHKAIKCKKEVACRKCAGQHKESECTTGIKKCINCVR